MNVWSGTEMLSQMLLMDDSECGRGKVGPVLRTEDTLVKSNDPIRSAASSPRSGRCLL